jgi:hypothetical protein
MHLDDEGEKLREATLRRLSLRNVEQVPAHSGETFEVVVTILGPRDQPLEEPMRESLAEVLAGQASRVIDQRGAGRNVVGIAGSRCDWSDEADCQTADGGTVNAFQAGERCYRVVLRVGVT